jgi:TatD DNase family protein
LPKAVKKERFVAGANQLIKGRNEPVCISQVAYVIANVKGISVEEVCEAAWKNTVDVFGLGVKTAE